MEQNVDAQNQSAETTTTGAAGGNSREMVALTEGRGGILGIKAGMTQIYTEEGDSIAVTVIDLKSAPVITQVKAKDKHGYQAIQVGIIPKKEKSANKAERGHAKASGAAGFYHYQEFR